MKLPSLCSLNIVLCLLVIGRGRLVVNCVGRERYSKLKILIIKLGGRLATVLNFQSINVVLRNVIHLITSLPCQN